MIALAVIYWWPKLTLLIPTFVHSEPRQLFDWSLLWCICILTLLWWWWWCDANAACVRPVPGSNSAATPTAIIAIRLICCIFIIVIYLVLLYKSLESLSTFIYYYKKILVERTLWCECHELGHYLTNVPIQILRDQDLVSNRTSFIRCKDKTIILAVLRVVSDIKNSVFADAGGPEWNPWRSSTDIDKDAAESKLGALGIDLVM